ncbi:MAG: CHASE2 domain-containing protein [Symploca sp. SIO1B1]|nr:CHASE2 domain-containing protein [Symploca sp. SIO1B1]
MLQSLELKAYDQMMRLRPDEGLDQRILLVTVTDNDVKAQDPSQRRGASLSDTALAQLLEKLEQYQPRVIGLHLYRDFSVSDQSGNLVNRFQNTEKLIALCKIGGTDNKGSVPPPPEITPNRLGFSDISRDGDGILRRHILGMAPGSSDCNTSYSFSLRVALLYLAKENIHLKRTPEDDLQIGSAIFNILEEDSGGYQQLDARTYQILLNYRASEKVAQRVTLAEVFNEKLTPEMVKDRIVLIGTTDKSFKDYWSTPYSTEVAGITIQAHMASQIISTVLDQRLLIGYWSQEGELLWIWCWSLVGGLLAWGLRSQLILGIAIITSIGVLSGLCYVVLIQGIWVLLVPSALALVATSGTVLVYRKSLKINNS